MSLKKKKKKIAGYLLLYYSKCDFRYKSLNYNFLKISFVKIYAKYIRQRHQKSSCQFYNKNPK